MRASLAAAVILALASPALADNAKPRGGGSSSSGSEGHHPSPSASSSSSSSGSHSSGSSSSSSQPTSDAERRHPRPGTGHGYRHGYYSYPYYPYNHYYYGGYPYYGYWGWGYGHYPSYGYAYGYPYGYRYSGYRNYGSVRILVEPDDTRVYVDGYYAGVVDDFDGIFQRLHVTPGRHEITLKLEGYRTHRMKVYVPPDETLKIHHDMVKGSGEDAVEDLAGPPGRYADDPNNGRDRDRDRDADDEDDDRDDRPADRDRDRDGDRGPLVGRDRDARGGAIHLTVRPDDASVYVDGSFRGSGRQVHTLELAPGRHRIEVVRPGFKTYDREVEVDGRGIDVDVELERP